MELHRVPSRPNDVRRAPVPHPAPTYAPPSALTAPPLARLQQQQAAKARQRATKHAKAGVHQQLTVQLQVLEDAGAGVALCSCPAGLRLEEVIAGVALDARDGGRRGAVASFAGRRRCTICGW